MQCPFCAVEIDPNTVVCKKCGAMFVTRRTPAGVMTGWIGMVAALMGIIMAIPLLVFPLISYSLKDYPWPAFIVCAIVAAGLLKYSRSTLHNQWIPGEGRDTPL